MSVCTRALVALSASALMAPTLVHAQETDIQALRREMQEMRRDYETRLQQMEDKLEAATAAQAQPAAGAQAPTPASSAASTPAPAPAGVAPPQAAADSSGGLFGSPPTGAGSPAYAPPTSAFRTPQAASSSANSFNPAIGAVLTGQFSEQSGNPSRYQVRGFALGDEAQPDPRGFAIGESEINAQANIDQWLFGNLTISYAQDNSVSVEEAFMQTTSLPAGFTLKAGRFFSGIGYLNEQHSHVWDFVDTALPYRTFLNNQYDDDGVQIRWLAPTDMFVELGTEAYRGDAFPAGGNARHGVGTYTAFAHIGDDIGASSSWRAGLSYLNAESRQRLTNGDADTYNGTQKLGILDMVYKWAPNGNPVERNLKLQSELFYGHNNGDFNTMPVTQRQWGWYAQGVYQFMPRWRFGVRHDEARATGGPDAGDGFIATALDDGGHIARRSSAMIDYSTSEFGRFRFQYNYDDAGLKVDHQVFLQYTVSIGAHGAHQF